MNCKPGDLAIVVGVASKCGAIIEVVKAAPLSRFKLPDGRYHVACILGGWIVRFPRAVPCLARR